MSTYHRSVLLHESLDALGILPEGVYVDVTFGGGGHSREILKRLGPKGKLIGFDQDEDAVKNAPDDSRFVLVKQNFSQLKNSLHELGINQVDGVLAVLDALPLRGQQLYEPRLVPTALRACGASSPPPTLGGGTPSGSALHAQRSLLRLSGPRDPPGNQCGSPGPV